MILIWSFDSKQIVFVFDCMGSMDVFIVLKDGGEFCCLIIFLGGEILVVFIDVGYILFIVDIMFFIEDVGFFLNG